MATCNNVSLIFDSECIGESLIKINTNFRNLDAGLCQLGQDLLTLDAFVKSLSAKDSSTIDMSFSVAGYFLSADVINDSLGTSKLGVDIPTTTKGFLTAAKVSSLIDAEVINPQSGDLLLWNGTKWINKEVVDQAGAKKLSELLDVDILSNPLAENQILKYNSSLQKWVNGVDETELTVRNGDYEDIRVSTGPAGLGPGGIGGPGTRWDIQPGKVGTLELATDAVTTPKIKDEAVVNDKIANNTITKNKLAFIPGEINTGINVGTGTAEIYPGSNIGTQIPIRRLRGAGACSVTESEDGNSIIISVPNTPDEAAATGANLGTGTGVYSDTKSSPGNLKFKRIKAGNGIRIVDGENEITISAVYNLGLSIMGVGSTGNVLTDSEIRDRVQSVYPASALLEGATCRVDVAVPEITPITNIAVSIPYSVIYYYHGCTFELREPTATPTGTHIYTQTKNLSGTATPSNQIVFRAPTRKTKEYKVFDGTWVFIRDIL